MAEATGIAEVKPQMEKGIEIGSPYVDKRPPAVPGQVRNASKLKLEKSYEEYEDGRLVGEFVLKGIPHLSKDKKDLWVIDAEYDLGGERVTVEKSLADLALKEYDNGKWNAKRYLKDPELLDPNATLAVSAIEKGK